MWTPSRPSFVVRSHDDGAFSDASISPVSADKPGSLPVHRFVAPETVGAAGMLAEAGTRVEALRLPRDQASIDGQLEIRLDKSLAGVAAQSLTYLEADTRQYRECVSTHCQPFSAQCRFVSRAGSDGASRCGSTR